ncbi:MAG: HypC/HybG/HupF family hydrogenase formation chaperone [Candidatus Omnitrophica bacterium]|nr:HypC/HybG/HupF family hydrogenase formation chaperone [Candidatus Omnitrophota bacterium]
MCLAVPGLVQSVENNEDPIKRTAKVSFDGMVREVSLGFLPEVKPGDYVVVHVGMALSKINADEAQKMIDDIHSIEELMKEES